MLIRTDNPIGFELEFNLPFSLTFLRLPWIGEMFNGPDGLVLSPWREVVQAHEAWKARSKEAMVE
jgi:hypothetical protein